MADSIAQLEQDLFNDIMDVRNAVVDGWDDIKYNAGQLHTLFQNLKSELEGISATGIASEIEPYIKQLKKAITNGLTNLENDLQATEQLFSPAIDDLLGDWKKVQSNTPVQDLEMVLDSIGKELWLDSDLQKALTPIGNIMRNFLENEVSFKLKDLPKHAPGGSQGGATKKQEAEAGATIFKALNTDLDDFITNNLSEIEGIPSKIEASLTSTLRKDLEQNVERAFAFLNPPISQLTLKQVTDALNTLAGDEKTDLETAITSIPGLLTSDISTIQGLIKKLFDGPWTDESALSELYQDVMGVETNPSLLEIISLVLAIPLTLVLKATGNPAELPKLNSAGNGFEVNLPANMALEDGKAVSGNANAYITTSVQIVSLALGVFDHNYSERVTKNGGTVPYTWVLFKGLIGVSCSTVLQAINTPEEPGEEPSEQLEYAFWIFKWISNVGLSLLSTLLKTYYTYELAKIAPPQTANLQNDIDTLKKDFTTFYKSCQPYLEGLKKAILNINKGIKTYDKVKFDPDYLQLPLVRINTGVYDGLKNSVANIQSESDLKNALSAIDKISTDDGIKFTASHHHSSSNNFANDVLEAIDNIKGPPQQRVPFKKSIKDDTLVIKNYTTTYQTIKSQLTALKATASSIAQSTDTTNSYNSLETEKTEHVDWDLTAVGLVFQLANMVLESIVDKPEKSSEDFSFGLTLAGELPEIIESISGLYFYHQKQNAEKPGTEEKEEKLKELDEQKETVEKITYYSGNVLSFTSAVYKSMMTAKKGKIVSAVFDPNKMTLTVTFNIKVVIATTNSIDSCFEISDDSVQIEHATPDNWGTTFTLTLSKKPSTDATIKVAKDSFKVPIQGDVEPTESGTKITIVKTPQK